KAVDVGSWCFIYGSCALSDSGYILCGQTYYATPNGSSDAYLMRINKNGDTLWTNHYGDIQDEIFNSVCVINDKIYVVGANATHPADTASDGWIVKLDMNGHKLKETFISFGTIAHQQEILNGVTPYSPNSFYACGQSTIVDSSNTIGAVRLKSDTDLNIISSSVVLPYKGATWILNKVLNISYGSTCVIGTKSGGAGGLGMYVVGFDRNDFYINDYSPTIGGTQNEYGYSGIYTSLGRVIAVGSTQSTIEYCSSPNLGLEDFFLVRYNSDSIHTQGVV